MYSKMDFTIKSSKTDGLATLNDVFAAAGTGAMRHFNATDKLKKQMMDHVANKLSIAIKNKELTADDMMTPESHIFIAIHPLTRIGDIDNVSAITKWITDAMEGLRVKRLPDGSLDVIGWYDPHSKSGKATKDTLEGEPFLANDNMANIIDVHSFYAGVSPLSYASIVWTSNWDEYETLLLQMSQHQRKLRKQLNKSAYNAQQEASTFAEG